LAIGLRFLIWITKIRILQKVEPGVYETELFIATRLYMHNQSPLLALACGNRPIALIIKAEPNNLNSIWMLVYCIKLEEGL